MNGINVLFVCMSLMVAFPSLVEFLLSAEVQRDKQPSIR